MSHSVWLKTVLNFIWAALRRDHISVLLDFCSGGETQKENGIQNFEPTISLIITFLDALNEVEHKQYYTTHAYRGARAHPNARETQTVILIIAES